MEHDQSTPEAIKRSPRTHVDSQPLPTDSMVTVSLSESDTGNPASEKDDDATTTIPQPDINIEENRVSRSSMEILGGIRERGSQESSIHTTSIMESENQEQGPAESPRTPQRSRSDSGSSSESAHVDWAELEKTEEEQARDDRADEAMALLLARLEQENNAIAHDPKSGIKGRGRSQSRPPSIHQLKRLVQEENTSNVRFSLLPSPPPMTELEFWAALVRDYPQTVQRLPTLTLNKIRSGIPGPLRGVVWQSMAGARERLIEDQYERLCGESSPYENIINKDIGRSFPGVDMFKDPEGEGQKMLGRVLKCFSLYDHKIGYCQGLGFLVGPLLMHMGDKEAFCVLVRLMEDYDLRSCFLPDLSGLHLRIYQFQRLLEQHMPKLAEHLRELQVESAYLSQWFLSFFAVTCPLPMLFRIYDVIFAEGASETIMRVALAIMKRNEAKILAFTEFEDVMQLLLSRGLWDPYGRNATSADQLVNDFVNFTNDVTRESLQSLEASFKEAKDKEGSSKGGFFPEAQKSASSFLGRLWGPSNSTTKSASLSPNLSAPSRPVSFLRRTPSKQSLASTFASTEGGSDSSSSTASTVLTEATSVSRGSSADALSIKSNTESVALSVRVASTSKDRDLHYQIEQLLTSISQLQRQNSELEASLQKQREDRREDHRIVRTVVDKIRSSHSSPTTSSRAERRRTTITSASLAPPSLDTSTSPPSELNEIAEKLDTRFPSTEIKHRPSSIFETKESLRESLRRTREQLDSANLLIASQTRELGEKETDLQSSRDALRETRHRLQESYNQNQRSEKMLQDLRSNARKGSITHISSPDGSISTPPSLSRSDTAESITSSGLREFRLGRSGSTKSVKAAQPQPTQTFSKRTSSLATQSILSSTEEHRPVDNEALLVELVNAKTAEASARTECDEWRVKFEALRKQVGQSGTPPVVAAPAAKEGTGGGWGWGGWKRSVSTSTANLTLEK